MSRRSAIVALAPLVMLGVVAIAALTGRMRNWSPLDTAPAPRLSLEDLLRNDPQRTGTLNLAAANLACARGLNGAEAMDEERCSQVLDGWARHVADETTKRRHGFLERPDYYEHSEAKFKMIQLVLTLPRRISQGPVVLAC